MPLRLRPIITSAYRLLGDFEVAISGGVWVATGALRKSKRSSNVWPWPLEPKHITINNFKIKSKPAQMVNISLKHVSLPLKEQLRPGVFLWALGVTQIEPVITASATCWKLDDIAWRSNQA
jgi:hypothetical protein